MYGECRIYLVLPYWHCNFLSMQDMANKYYSRHTIEHNGLVPLREYEMPLTPLFIVPSTYNNTLIVC